MKTGVDSWTARDFDLDVVRRSPRRNSPGADYGKLRFRHIGPVGTARSRSRSRRATRRPTSSAPLRAGSGRRRTPGSSWKPVFDKQPVMPSALSRSRPPIRRSSGPERARRSSARTSPSETASGSRPTAARRGSTWGSRDGSHRPRDRPSRESRHRLRGGSRPRLRPAARARRLPHEGRRKDLGARPLRGREDRRLRSRHGSEESTHPLCGNVAARAQDLDPRERRTGKRNLRDERRRRHLERGSRGTAFRASGREDRALHDSADSNRLYALIETGDGVPWHGEETESGELWRSSDGGKMVAGEPRPRARRTKRLLLPLRGRDRRPRRGLLPRGVLQPQPRWRRLLRDRRGHGLVVSRTRLGSPRHVDRCVELRSHGGRARRRSLDLGEPREVLAQGSASHRADVPRHGRRPGTLLRVRKPAGRTFVPRSEQQPDRMGFGATGITRDMWHSVGGGESGFATPDPVDPDVIWSSASGAGARGGIVVRYRESTRQFRQVEVWPESTGGWPAAELRYRFQWTSPFWSHPTITRRSS